MIFAQVRRSSSRQESGIHRHLFLSRCDQSGDLLLCFNSKGQRASTLCVCGWEGGDWGGLWPCGGTPRPLCDPLPSETHTPPSVTSPPLSPPAPRLPPHPREVRRRWGWPLCDLGSITARHTPKVPPPRWRSWQIWDVRVGGGTGVREGARSQPLRTPTGLSKMTWRLLVHSGKQEVKRQY